MGRHRRVTTGATPRRSASTTGHGRHRSARRRPAPVRTGLLGASAALAVGVVSVTTGLIPTPGGTVTVADPGVDDRGRVKDAGDPTTHSGAPRSPSDRASRSAERDGLRTSASPSQSPSESAPTRSAESGGTPTATPDDTAAREDTATPRPTRSTPDRPSRTPSDRPSPSESTDPGTGGESPGEEPDEAATQEAQVLRLVNAERAQVGCAPLTVDPELSALARSHSKDMAERGYFSHTTPEGHSPWDRAAAAGVDDMGGENIARGQADAEAVMASWMSSEGHRANILNCDFRTLGVGAHFASGGPWWTQTFGY